MHILIKGPTVLQAELPAGRLQTACSAPATITLQRSDLQGSYPATCRENDPAERTTPRYR